MRSLRLLAPLFLLLLSGLASAGEIYGSISVGDRRVGEGVPVEIKCGAKTYPPQKTDKSGAYHLAVNEEGKCLLTVTYKNEKPSLEVASYEEAVQVDLVLETKDGKLTIRRK